MKLYPVSWKEFDGAVLALAGALADKTFGGIYALPRGGLPLGVALSHRLNTPLLSAPADGVLLVDDIADSGAAIRSVTARCTPAAIAVWFKRTTCDLNGLQIGRYVDPGLWVVFPWEDFAQAERDYREYLAKERS